MKKYLLVLFLSPFFYQPFADAQTSIGVVCIAANNSIVVRSKKCKASETKATLAQLALKGATGDTGAKGADGSPGLLGRVAVYEAFSRSFPGSVTSITVEAFCPVGQVSVGGGCISDSTSLFLLGSYPFDGSPLQSWRCTYSNVFGSAVTANLTPLVVCANAGLMLWYFIDQVPFFSCCNLQYL